MKVVIQMFSSGLFVGRRWFPNKEAVLDTHLYPSPEYCDEGYSLQHIGDPAIGVFVGINVFAVDEDLKEQHFSSYGATLQDPIFSHYCSKEEVPFEKAVSEAPYKFVYDGPLFSQRDLSGGGAFVYLQGQEKDWYEAEVEVGDGFDPEKLEIHYKSARGDDGSTNFLSKWLVYDGKPYTAYESMIYNGHGNPEDHIESAWVESSSGIYSLYEGAWGSGGDEGWIEFQRSS